MRSSATPSLDVYVCTGRGRAENPPPNAGGIQQYRMSLADGALKPVGFFADPPSAGHLALHPDGHHLYALHGLREVSGQPGGGASAYRIDNSGGLTPLNLRSVHGLWPSYSAFDPSGRWLIAVNYGTGNVVVLPILEDGTLGEASYVVQHEGSSVNLERQEAPHAHSVVIDPGECCALVADLGLDKIITYRLHRLPDALQLHFVGALNTRPGCGPRHLAYHPSGRFLYCTNELDSSLTAYSGEAADGTLHEFQTLSTLPAEYRGQNSPAHLQFAPSGRTLYVSNRGHDSIAIFEVDAASGKLTPVSHISTGGSSPRHLAVDPTGQYLLAANERSSSLATFSIEVETGELSMIAMMEVPNPVFVLCRAR